MAGLPFGRFMDAAAAEICRTQKRGLCAARIKPQDRVVIFATAEAVKQVEQMFRVSLEFF